jgi:hypothetical protein
MIDPNPQIHSVAYGFTLLTGRPKPNPAETRDTTRLMYTNYHHLSVCVVSFLDLSPSHFGDPAALIY